MKKYFLYTVLFFGFYSCSNDNLNEETNEDLSTIVFKSGLENYDNQVIVYTSGANNIYNDIGNVQTDFNTKFEDFKINEKTFSASQFSNHVFDISSTLNSDYQSLMNTGLNATVDYEGINENVYVPKRIFLNENDFDDNISLHFSKTNGKNINWNTDTANPVDRVFIVITERDTPFTGVNKSVNSITLEVADTGNIAITANDLQKFTVGSDLDFYIARGNEKIIGNTGFTFYNVNLIYGKVVN
jgi:hypothetical protein